MEQLYFLTPSETYKINILTFKNITEYIIFFQVHVKFVKKKFV